VYEPQEAETKMLRKTKSGLSTEQIQLDLYLQGKQLHSVPYIYGTRKTCTSHLKWVF